MPQFKSTCKKIKEFDFGGEVVIDRLSATKEMVDFHHDRMKTSFPDMKEKEIWQKINNIVIRDNVFNAAMKKVVDAYEFKIEKEDIDKVVDGLKKANPRLEKAKTEVLEIMAKRMIEKELIFQDVQKLWKIEVSDQEVKDVLQKMYETTNYPIRDLMNDPKKIEGLKAPILEQKTADVIISKIKWKLDHEAIKRNATPPKTETKKEENKK